MKGTDGTIEQVKSVARKLLKSNVESAKFKGFQEEEGFPEVELEKVLVKGLLLPLFPMLETCNSLGLSSRHGKEDLRAASSSREPYTI